MAARNITIAFGELVVIPAKAEVATDSPPEVANLCPGQPDHASHEPSPLKAPRSCPECGPVTDYSVLLKGVRAGKTYTLLTQEEVAAAKESYAGEYKGKISLQAVWADEFDTATAPGDRLYYLTPATEAVANQYQTLRVFVEAHPELAFIGLWTPVSITGLYRVTVRDDVLVMEARTRSQALRPKPQIEGEPMNTLSKFLEMTLAEEGVVSTYDPDAYEDGYRTALDRLTAASARTVTIGGEKTSTPVAGMSDADLLTKLAALRDAS